MPVSAPPVSSPGSRRAGRVGYLGMASSPTPQQGSGALGASSETVVQIAGSGAIWGAVQRVVLSRSVPAAALSSLLHARASSWTECSSSWSGGKYLAGVPVAASNQPRTGRADEHSADGALVSSWEPTRTPPPHRHRHRWSSLPRPCARGGSEAPRAHRFSSQGGNGARAGGTITASRLVVALRTRLSVRGRGTVDVCVRFLVSSSWAAASGDCNAQRRCGERRSRCC
jgi:hypothetical protein